MTTMTNRRHPHSIPAAALAVLSVATACGGDDTRPTTVDLSATPSIETLRLPEAPGFATAISSDGSLLAYRGDDGLCVVSTGGGDPRCAPFEAPLDLTYASFSPDNSSLVITEDFLRALYEPDIWTLDVESMTLTNRTDDGVSEVSLGGDDDGSLLDTAPAWTADGEIVFVRSRRGTWDAQVLRLGADDELTEIAALPPADGPVYVFPLVSLDDGSFVTVTSPAVDAPHVLRVDGASGDVSLVTAFPDDELSTPRIVDVNGTVALIRSERIVGTGRPGLTSHAIVDLETGRIVPFFPDDRVDGDDVSLQAATAAFSPDGTSIVFATMANGQVLRAVDVAALLTEPATAPVTELLDLAATTPGAADDIVVGWSPVLPLRWTPNGELIGVVGFDRVATVSFGDPG